MMGPDTQGFGEAYLFATTVPLHDPPPTVRSIPDPDPLRAPPQPVIDRHQSPLDTYPDPPSYADAVDDDPSSNGHDTPKSQPPNSNRSISNFLNISVSDPQKDPELGHYTYLITTNRTGADRAVRRRFRDVVALSDRLSETHRGFFVPVRPDKSPVESQVMEKTEFVEQRRSALEKYLNKLASHPSIGPSEELRAFLEARQLVEAVVDAASARGGKDLIRLFKELKQTVVNDWGGARPPVVEEDREFLEKKERLVEFEHRLTGLSQQAESLVRAQQGMGEAMGEFGLSFVKLTKFEVEEAVYESQRVRANDMRNVAIAAVKASRLYRELNSKTVQHLDKLHEYLGVMLAVNSAFSDRSNALLTVQTLSSDISSVSSRIEKLEVASSKIFGGDRSRNRKIEELKETMKITEDAKNCAVIEYERIKENNRSELERLDKEVHSDFLSMLKGLVVNQAGYSEKMASVWEKVADETSGYAKIAAKE